MNRTVLDNWSIREQLCLASAVSCSGDQNWVSVSRNLKAVCGNNNNETSRPADWFSQKSCALQYSHLLENVETPKRKKRSSEGNSRVSSPANTVETPTDSVLRRLTEERIEELTLEIRKEQEEYAKIHGELQKIQSPQLSEEALREMWREIEQELEAQRIAEMKLENQMREREQRRQDVQRNWRLSNIGPIPSSKQENTSVVDMDVEEIIGVSKPIIPAQQQTATSPLLSSLLKSPTATVAPTLPNPAPSPRTTAPTIIHTLLTSGSIPNSSQPAITLNSDLIPPEKAVKLLTRPISGPPGSDSANVSSATAHNLLSPSQSAPTLSMLLEKNKPVQPAGTGQQSKNSSDAEPGSNASKSKAEELKKKDEPMEEDATAQVSKVENEANADSDEPDPNEEQQLMEVFKNIGNIELDIDVAAVINDEEVDFLKGVDEDSPTGTGESMDFETKTEEAAESVSELKNNEKIEKTATINDTNETKSEKMKSEDEIEEKVIKLETSSDDSNDNIPLAAVATLENKERTQLTPTTETEDKSNGTNFLKAKVEPATTSVEDSNNKCQQQDQSLTNITSCPDKDRPEDIESIKAEPKDEKNDAQTAANSVSKDDAVEEVYKEDTTEEVLKKSTSEKPIEEDVDDEEAERFATPIGDEKLLEKEETSENISIAEENSKSDASRADNDNAVDNSTSEATVNSEDPSSCTAPHTQESVNINESATSLPPPAPNHISIADTDEDSCTTDISVITTATKREEKLGTSSSSSGTRNTSERGASQTRKAGSNDTLSKSTEDSDSSSGNRTSKRSLLSILNTLSSTKSAQTLQLALTDDQVKSKYQRNCYCRLDFQIIKKNIDSGSIRSVIDLQRDLLRLAQNVNFLFNTSSPNYKAAEVFKHEMQSVREFVFNAHEFDTKSEKEVKEIKQSAGKPQGRTGSRKSLRIS